MLRAGPETWCGQSFFARQAQLEHGVVSAAGAAVLEVSVGAVDGQ